MVRSKMTKASSCCAFWIQPSLPRTEFQSAPEKGKPWQCGPRIEPRPYTSLTTDP